MENETFSTLSKEYYEILHDIDHLCQTFRRQGKRLTDIVMYRLCDKCIPGIVYR